jgi:hypothetical protein
MHIQCISVKEILKLSSPRKCIFMNCEAQIDRSKPAAGIDSPMVEKKGNAPGLQIKW